MPQIDSSDSLFPFQSTVLQCLIIFICQQSELRCCYRHRYYQIRAQDASFNNSISSTDFFFIYLYLCVLLLWGGKKAVDSH